MSQLRILTAVEVQQALPMADAIAAMKSAFAQLSSQQAVAPLRLPLPVLPHQGTTLVMPAYLPADEALAVKLVSVFPQNAQRGQKVVHGLVLTIEAETGRPLALLEGASLTAIRTGAGSGAATDLLARPDAHVAAIFGSGAQARTQLEAVCTVRPGQEVRVYNLVAAHAEQFAAEMAGLGPIPANIRVVDQPQTAVADADIICTATTASQPVFDGRHLKPGVHINGVGSFLPTMQEVDAHTIQQALVFVDSYEGAWAEAGDLIVPWQQGLIGRDHVQAEIGELVNGSKSGRTAADQITFFKSVGTAVQDAAAAKLALQQAQRLGLGTAVSL